MSKIKITAKIKNHSWDKYMVGFDKDLEYGKERGFFVYKFPNEDKLTEFLEEVGGTLHPFGGLRAILSEKH
jgi:hypothetical protein